MDELGNVDCVGYDFTLTFFASPIPPRRPIIEAKQQT